MRPIDCRRLILTCCLTCIFAACATRDAGYKITKDTVAFIQPGTTTRSEVIENLGPPLLDLPDVRASAYSWGRVRATGARPVQSDERFQGRPMGYAYVPPPMAETGTVESRRWVYAIAWDEAGHVQRAERLELEGARSLERAVRAWVEGVR